MFWAMALLLGGVLVVAMLASRHVRRGRQRSRSSAPSLELACIAGSMRGRIVPVGNADVVIGRDRAECTIVYGESATSVSRRHCTIQWDAATGGAQLVDDGSKNGTYCADGRRLTPGEAVRLDVGQAFSVGSPQDTWRLQRKSHD